MARRRRLRVEGTVQGVGFRPFVYALAEDLGLGGWVSNTSAGVMIEAEGPDAALAAFEARLRDDAPPLAEVVAVTGEDLPAAGETAFAIRFSEDTPGTDTALPPDVAVCPDCRREIRDPADRRCGYAFTNCTNCGPRWTIIDRIPYDRPFTSMASFPMCDACRAEYDDPRDRRFHAQPNACPACGPRLEMHGEGIDPAVDPLDETARLLVAGRIVAIKGLGGFHLAVRADDETAVARLRTRKGREAKPLALMARDLEAAARLAVIGEAEREALVSPAAPIVLLTRRTDAPVAPCVAPDRRRLGVMLAYTPLHLLLCDRLEALGVPALVMTSGNVTDEPICLDDAEARTRLAGVADAWLGHDRPIRRRADDSVLLVTADGPLLLRRSRGFAPRPVAVAADGPTVLAAGGELKNVVGLLHRRRCILSPHVGDVENLATYEFFRATADGLAALFEAEPEILACDRHPAYLTSQWARAEAARRGLPLVEVQHHHAHLAAALAEHGCDGPAVGLILDGTGWGDDGTVWGGEILVGDARGCERAGHLEPFPLPGGDAAVRAPWRTAVSLLRLAFGDAPPPLPWLADRPAAAVLEQLDRGVNAPLTSSAGRLFDGIAALTGRWGEIRHEAQAAVELTDATSADAARAAAPWPLELSRRDGRLVLGVRALVRAAAADILRGADAAEVAARFHRSLADALTAAAAAVARARDLQTVVLTGGTFQNEVLLALVREGLERRGLRPLRPLALSPNDSALALGQAVIARAALA